MQKVIRVFGFGLINIVDRQPVKRTEGNKSLCVRLALMKCLRPHKDLGTSMLLRKILEYCDRQQIQIL